MSLVVKFNENRVHELYPEASMVPAMKIWQLPKHKRNMLKECCDSGKYLASTKIDGFFYMLNKTPNFTYLFSVHLPESAPSGREVLSKCAYRAPVYLSVAGDDPISGDSGLAHAEIVAAMLDEQIKFLKRAVVKKEVKPLPRCQLAGIMLFLDASLGAGF